MTDPLTLLENERLDLMARLEAERARRKDGRRTEKVIGLEALLCDRTAALMRHELNERTAP